MASLIPPFWRLLLVRPHYPVQQDNTIHVILHAVVAVGSPLFFGFMALKHHTASRWMGCVFVILGIVGVPWGIFGVLRLGYASHFTRATRATFDHFESVLGGFALGLLVSLLLSPEFWQIAGRGRNRSNQALERTVTRQEKLQR